MRPLTWATLKKWAGGTLALLLLGGVSGFMVLPFMPNHARQYAEKNDVLAFYTAAQIVKTYGRSMLYEIKLQKDVQSTILSVPLTAGVLTYRNPPLLAYSYYPLAHLSFVTFFQVFGMLNILITGLCIYLLGTQLFKLNYLVQWAILISYLPVYWAVLFVGQPTPVIFLAFILQLIALKKNRPITAGLLSVVTAFKPQLLLQLIFIAAGLRGPAQKKYLASAAFAQSVFWLINAWLYGAGFFPKYLKFALETEKLTRGTVLLNNFNLFTFNEVLSVRLPGYLAFWLIFSISMVSCCALWLWLAKNWSADIVTLSPAIAIFSLFLTGHTMFTDLVFLTVPLGFFVARLENLTLSAIKSFEFRTAVLLYFLPILAFVFMQPIIVTVTLYLGLCFLGKYKNQQA